MITPPGSLKQDLTRIITILLVLTSTAFIGLWIASVCLWDTETISMVYDARTSYFISSHEGRIELARQYAPPTTNMSVSGIAFSRPTNVSRLGAVWGSPQRVPAGSANASNSIGYEFDAHELLHGLLGFGWTSIHILRMVAIPDWFFAIITGTSAFLLWRRSNRPYKLQIRCLCRECGYDLRATPDRCPECGTVVPGRSASFLKHIAPHLYRDPNQEKI